MANACILFGYAVSAVIFNEFQTRYINPDNASPDKQYSPEFPDEKYFSKEVNGALLDRVPKSYLIICCICVGLQIVGMSIISEYDPEEIIDEKTVANERTGLINEIKSESEIKSPNSEDDEKEENSLGVKYKSLNEGMDFKEALKTGTFWNIMIILNFSTLASGNVVTFFKTFGQTFLDDDDFFAMVASAASLCNAFGRLWWGFLIDKLPLKVCLLIIQTLVIALTSTFYFSKLIAIKEVYLIWVCAIYFSMCGIASSTPTIIAKSFGQKEFTSIYSFTFFTYVSEIIYLEKKAILKKIYFKFVSNFASSTFASYKDHFGWFVFGFFVMFYFLFNQNFLI